MPTTLPKSLIFSFIVFFAACRSSSKDVAVQNPNAAVSSFTQKVHRDIKDFMPFSDSTDFLNASKGFIATRNNPEILNPDGSIAYHLDWFTFLKDEAPATVNPLLWRQSRLNQMHGLYEVVEGIYQVRGFDLANMTVIESENGWIVIDPLTSKAPAKAAIELVFEQLGKKPIQAILLTHSHIDHFGGIRGILEQNQEDEPIEIIAPEGFYEHAIGENIIAGNAMIRRSLYMFGVTLPRDSSGMVGSGLGQIISRGDNGVVVPTKTISQTGEKLNIDGIEFEFQHTPGAEAPSEFMFYLPQFKAFCQAEEISHTHHNLYTPRGAKVRNGLTWSKYIDETILLYGEKAEVSFGSHHWPVWGREAILDLWKNQRDLYKFIHDETLHLANQGYNKEEIAEMIRLPESLAKSFANRDYYGTISHNSKAQYQLYYGWFDGNPANLNPLPPEEEAKKYVAYMGGADSVIARAKKDYTKGEYRWVSTALNHVVFADPTNQEARKLLAQTYTQMAYQAESGPWRNFYLTGAYELLNGINAEVYPKNSLADSPDILTGMPLETFFDYLAVRLDRDKLKGKTYSFNFIFPDIDQKIHIFIENTVLHNRIGVLGANPNATIEMNKSTFNEILTKESTAVKKITSGELKIKGSVLDYMSFQKIVGEPFELLFNVIEP